MIVFFFSKCWLDYESEKNVIYLCVVLVNDILVFIYSQSLKDLSAKFKNPKKSEYSKRLHYIVRFCYRLFTITLISPYGGLNI